MNFDLYQNIRLSSNGNPYFRQLAENLKAIIINGTLAPGDKFPSLNDFSKALNINRLTVLRALDELEIEGWILKKEKSGAYVADQLPKYEPSALSDSSRLVTNTIEIPVIPISNIRQDFSKLSFNDGYPDYRLFPAQEVSRAYSTVLKDHFFKSTLSYYDVFGHEDLRQTISSYCHKTRGIKSSVDNVMITRGSSMGIYLAAKSVCEPGDIVIMGKPGYYIAKETFESNGLKVIKVDTDEGGISTDQIREILKKEKVKMVYTTSHHDYPTTVTMPAERRLELLDMASNYGFFILEDDYDFDFQYDRSPILPIASIDQLKYVIYVGGFSKSVAPAMRIGFMLADQRILENAGKLRKIIDRQGDTVQELAFDKLMKREVISSTIRKIRKIYHTRRDLAYQLFQEHFQPYITTNLPNGGLAFWVKLNLNSKQIEDLLYRSKQKGVFLLDPKRYSELTDNYTRMGFASMNEEELTKSVEIVRDCLKLV